MKKKILFHLFFIPIFLFSCKNVTPKNKHPDDIHFNELEYYTIILTKSQIHELGISRKITLTNTQLNIIKHKIKSFHVGGPRYFAPPGWFYANWTKPDEIKIKKIIIDDFSNLIKDNNFTKSQSQNVIINITLTGDYFINNSKYSVSQLINLINNRYKIYKTDNLSIYISYPPFDNKTIEENVIKDMRKIAEFARNKNLHFQDDF